MPGIYGPYCALKIAAVSITKPSSCQVQIVITFDWLIGFLIFLSCQKVHLKIFDFALPSFVITHLVPKLLELKRFISLQLITCPTDSLSVCLVHCPLQKSLATIWKQDYKPNFVSILEHLHSGVTIPFAFSFSETGNDPISASSNSENRQRNNQVP